MKRLCKPLCRRIGPITAPKSRIARPAGPDPSTGGMFRHRAAGSGQSLYRSPALPVRQDAIFHPAARFVIGPPDRVNHRAEDPRCPSGRTRSFIWRHVSSPDRRTESITAPKSRIARPAGLVLSSGSVFRHRAAGPSQSLRRSPALPVRQDLFFHLVACFVTGPPDRVNHRVEVPHCLSGRTQWKERSTALRQPRSFSSRSAAVMAGVKVRSTAQLRRMSSRPDQKPTASPAR